MKKGKQVVFEKRLYLFGRTQSYAWVDAFCAREREGESRVERNGVHRFVLSLRSWTSNFQFSGCFAEVGEWRKTILAV